MNPPAAQSQAIPPHTRRNTAMTVTADQAAARMRATGTGPGTSHRAGTQHARLTRRRGHRSAPLAPGIA
jgi:hypothetical protein